MQNLNQIPKNLYIGGNRIDGKTKYMSIYHVFTRLIGIMKLTVLLFFIIIVSNRTVNAQIQKFGLSIGGAMHINNMTWSIAGNSGGQSPNILSELDFRNITSLGIYIDGYYTPLKFLQLEVYYQRNSVVQGKGTDIDYAGDDRTKPILNQPFSSAEGFLHVYRMGAKYQFFRQQKFTFGGGIAYRKNLQNFLILSPENANLRSAYQAQWQGPALSIEGMYRISDQVSVNVDFSYILFRYRAKANWNLIEIFEHPLSFMHNAKGNGKEVGINFHYALTRTLSLSLGGRVGNLRSDQGTEVTYLKNGVRISKQFNGSVNDYSAIRLGTNFMF